MKKLLVFLLLAVSAIQAKAALFINNSTTCPAVVILYAHDGTNSANCAYYSGRFTVGAGTAVTFNNTADVNSPAGPGWFLPGTNGIMPNNGTWDAARVYYNQIGPLGYQDVGNPGTCAPALSYAASIPGCSFNNVTWMSFGGNTFLFIQ